MTKVVGDIVIDVFADVSGLVRELGRGEGAVSGFNGAAQRLGTRMQALGSRATALGQNMSIATAAITAGAAALGVMVTRAAAAGDRVANAARQVGLSSEAYQEYAFAIGEAANVTESEFDAALVVMNRRLGEAREGSTSAVAALERVGISAADIAAGSVTTEQALAAMVSTLESTTDPAIAAAIAADLMGRTGAKMGSAMSGAAGQVDDLRDRARELGIVMDGKALKAAEDYSDAVDGLSKQWQAAQVAIAAEVLPFFVNTLVPALRDTVIPAIVDAAGKVGDMVEWFQGLPEPVQAAAGAIAAAFAVGGPVLIAIGAVASAIGGLVAATGPIGLLIAAAGLLTAAWITWGDDFKAAVAPAIDFISGKFEAFLALLDRIMTRLREYGTAAAEALNISTTGVENEQRRDAQIRMQRDGGPGTSGTYLYSPGVGGAPGGALGGQAMGAGIVTGMLLGVGQSIEENREAFGNLFAQVPQIARDVLGINSPSTVFADIGGFMGEGMANGIQASTEMVAGAVRQVAAGAVGAADAMSNDILSAMGILFAGSQKVGAGIALVNTMIGASEELKKGTFGIVSAARVVAQGMAFIKAIKSASANGGGSAGASATAPAAAPQAPLDVRLTGFGPNDLLSGADLGALLDGLSKQAGDRGYRIMVPM